MSLWVQETWINRTKGWSLGDSDVYESFADTLGELFRHGQKEHGRCVSKVYIDDLEGKSKPIGWVFEKTAHYEDTGEPFTLETWVTVHDAPPTKTVTYHYHEQEVA